MIVRQRRGDTSNERRLPFYVMAPTYDERSAGNRVLHTLAETLAELGYEAFVGGKGHAEALMPGQRRAGILNAATARAHYDQGRTPIVIYPETTFKFAAGGVRVLYLLNFPGVMGGPNTLPDCDAVVAYASDIARKVIGVDEVLFIPVSNPEFWIPAPGVDRTLGTVYAGKFVDHHGQSLPAQVDGLLRITRHHPAAPSRHEIRFLLQRSRCFHVFENTALAAEAALCGCPVVLHPGPYFADLIGTDEVGLAGFTEDASVEGLAKASEGLPAFRERYLTAHQAIRGAVATFAERMQHLGSTKPASAPFLCDWE